MLRAVNADVFMMFDGQVLPFDTTAADHYAPIVNGRARLGLPIDGFDAQIASICRANDAVLATRRVMDFQHTGVAVVDPWQHSTR